MTNSCGGFMIVVITEKRITLLEKNTGHWWDKLGKPQYGGELKIRLNRKIVNFDPYYGVHLTQIHTTWMEKMFVDDWTMDPAVYDYRVDPALKQLYREHDYGRYADRDGSMHVAFTASNHTTGGNSGSPVLNADGNLIGVNFDRNWEGTMSDMMYDPGQCRNITLDIRYCLFIIDKYAGAQHLVKEMNILE